MRETVEILAIGSSVIVDGEIPAQIIAVEIRGTAHLISYQCCWWDERNRKSEWLYAAEITPAVPEKHKAGIVK